jgi:DNA-binding Lrp family transcriptional regulator
MKFSELEFRAIQVLRKNPRITVKELALELNVNRNTASRVLRSVLQKGVKLKVTLDNRPTIFIVGECASWCEECYPLIDENNMCVARADDVDSLLRRTAEVKAKQVFISMKGNISDPQFTMTLTCDYCGKEIHQGEKYFTYNRNNRTYYLCCTSCLKGIKYQLEKRSEIFK